MSTKPAQGMTGDELRRMVAELLGIPDDPAIELICMQWTPVDGWLTVEVGGPYGSNLHMLEFQPAAEPAQEEGA